MKKKNVLLISSIFALIVIVSILLLFLINNNSTIPDDYIAVFHGGDGEIVHETYIYKIDNDHSNYGFNYINVESTTSHWGSSEWNKKITAHGSVQWTDDVFKVAKENGAYSYVTVPTSSEAYTIEQFMKMFIMN